MNARIPTPKIERVELLVRSKRRSNFGALIYGIDADQNGFAVECAPKLIPDSSCVELGQMWLVEGPMRVRTTSLPNGFVRHERVITAQTAELTRPSGQRWINWIIESKDCLGIGSSKARLLWDTFGPDLERLADEHDIAALSKVLSHEMAERLCFAIQKSGIAKALNWMDQVGMPRSLGRKVVEHWGAETSQHVEANPYHLISFEAKWGKVDAFARSRLKVEKDDQRRLVAAIEQCLYDAIALGHTCLPIPEIRRRVAKRLSDSKQPDWKLADAAMLLTEGSSQQGYLPFRRIGDRLQVNGMSIIEADIAERLLQMAAGEEALGQAGLFSQVVVNPHAVELLVDGYLAGGKYKLNAEQKQAVKTCSVNHFSMILGGAGTGKTTVLDALYKSIMAQHPGILIYQIALAGLASQRMQQATGLPAMTIASFLLNVDEGGIEIGSLIVVDESSMVDVLLFHRLLRHLPPGVRLILVGDHCQLPGIGPGVILHALAGHPKIAQTHLIQITRQSQASGIPEVAQAIRNHQIPKWDNYHPPAVARRPAPRQQDGLFDLGVSFIACPNAQINETVVRVYEELGGCGHDHSVQLLSPLKDGPGGVNDLNFILHGKFHKKSPEVLYESVQYGEMAFITKKRLTLREGDLVMFTVNDYELNLRNGTLGRVQKALPIGEPGAPCCTVSFDGREYDFTVEQAGNLLHAYALTVHKGQGNQFKRVVIPIRSSNLLDNSMIYTAVTRGVEQVVLVGDVNAAVAAILGPSNAAKRCVMLPTLLESSTI